ncbi:glutamine ABC transporter periplasmic protein [compost metagenome]
MGAEGTADARAQLRQSRLDAAVQGSETLPYIMKLDEKAYKALGQPILKQYFGLGVGKDNPELSKSIADTLQEMIVDGTYLAILKKWDLQEGAIERATLNLK